MDDELSSLSGTAGKQSPKDSNIQSTFQRGESHLHKRGASKRSRFIRRVGIQARTATGGGGGPVIFSQTRSTHGHDTANAAGEHSRPLTFTNLFSMIGSSHSPGSPFLLKEGSVGEATTAESLQIIQVIFAP